MGGDLFQATFRGGCGGVGMMWYKNLVKCGHMPKCIVWTWPWLPPSLYERQIRLTSLKYILRTLGSERVSTMIGENSQVFFKQCHNDQYKDDLVKCGLNGTGTAQWRRVTKKGPVSRKSISNLLIKLSSKMPDIETFRVEPHRSSNRFTSPVHHQVIDQLFLRETEGKASVLFATEFLICPAGEFLENIGQQTGGRVR